MSTFMTGCDRLDCYILHMVGEAEDLHHVTNSVDPPRLYIVHNRTFLPGRDADCPWMLQIWMLRLDASDLAPAECELSQVRKWSKIMQGVLPPLLVVQRAAEGSRSVQNTSHIYVQ